MNHLNIGEKRLKSPASEDLTVVLLRGNGSPRSFRVSLPALHRSLTAVGFLFALAILASAVLLGFSFFQSVRMPLLVSVTAPPSASVAPPATESPAAPVAESGGLWSKMGGGASSESELQKEVEGLRQENARLNSRADDRKPLTSAADAPLMQFFGPRSSLTPEAQTYMRIRNPRISKEADGKQSVLTFELHNVHPEQRQQRGYIMAVAKAPDLLLTYPANSLSPSDNILLDFTKGETFAISRFREAKATFPLPLLEGRKVSYQILLFAPDGKVVGNLHVEGGK